MPPECRQLKENLPPSSLGEEFDNIAESVLIDIL